MAGWTYYPFTTLPSALDIVWCWFPEHLDLGKPGPKSRPGLVICTGLTEDDEPEVRICFGTSNLKTDSRPFDFFVTNMNEMNIAGLFQATRFDLDRILWMPWSTEFFRKPHAKPSPVIGHLSGAATELLALVSEARRKRGMSSLLDE